jgi:hypothetical protein
MQAGGTYFEIGAYRYTVEPNKTSHEVHTRFLARYTRHIRPVEQLKDYAPADDHGGQVLVRNATGNGAEVLAWAWCAEKGKNALIRRTEGPCYSCAVQSVRREAFGVWGFDLVS